MQKRSNSGKQLGLMDALAISTGSTIAAGVFILGAIAINYAGESILASIAIAAVLAILSGICLSQLSAVVSKDGSLYEYKGRSAPFLASLWGYFESVRCWLSLQPSELGASPT